MKRNEHFLKLLPRYKDSTARLCDVTDTLHYMITARMLRTSASAETDARSHLGRNVPGRHGVAWTSLARVAISSRAECPWFLP